MTELSKEALEARRKYHREWNHAHPDKIKEYNRRRWESMAAKEREKRSGEDNDSIGKTTEGTEQTECAEKSGE